MTPTKGEKRNRRTSTLWNYFTIIDYKYASCNLCGNKMTHCSSSSNLRKHLIRKHSNYQILNTQSQTATNTTQNAEFVDMDYEIEESVTTEDPVEQEVVPLKTFKFSNIHNTTIPSQLSKIPKQKPHNNSQMIQEAISILSNVAHTAGPPETEDDEFGQFGKYVTAQLRQLPLLNALEIQEKFYSLLTRERINVMKNATEAHTYIKSNVQQHQCNHQQQNNHQERKQQEHDKDHHQCTQQKKAAKLQIESACSLNQSLQPEIETYTEMPVSTTIECVVDS